MIYFFQAIYLIIASPQLLLTVITLSIGVKIYFISKIVPQGLHAKKLNFQWLLLFSILVGSIFGDVAWIARVARRLWFAQSSTALVNSIIRIAWGFTVLQFQALTLFIYSLINNKFKLTLSKKITSLISFILFIYYMYVAAFLPTDNLDHAIPNHAKSNSALFEHGMMQYTVLYLIGLLILQGLYTTFKHLRNRQLPKILRRQLKFFLIYLICPYLLIEFMQGLFITWTNLSNYINPAVNLSTINLIFAILYCMNRVMGFRFLHIADHVKSLKPIKSVADFKQVIEQLSHATSMQELGHITQAFFKEKFTLPLHYTNLYIRNQSSERNSIEVVVEQFMNAHNKLTCNFIEKRNILIYDEIAFNNFYEQDEIRTEILQFLDSINVDIFLPIYVHEKIVAYITIKKDARGNECYSNVERDEMIIFANYLSNIIHLLQNKHIDSLIYQTKELNEIVYAQQQQISQYQESIRSFLRTQTEKKIGIVCYKNRHFIYGNHAAKEMIQINLNKHEGNPLTQTFKAIAQKVENYKSPQTTLCQSTDGTNLVISAAQHLEQNMVIMTVSYPDITDMLSKHIANLSDLNLRDYILYLQTTEAGKRIEQIIPSHMDTLLNFKINFMHLALSKRALLLDVHEDDMLSFVELLHYISKRETLHVLNLREPVHSLDIAIQLFGINSVFGTQSVERPLLERLDETGTLFIKNLHHLDSKSQDYLAEYIRSGSYRTFKSDQKKNSNVRIICSSARNLPYLVQEGRFSEQLLNQIAPHTITMPSLATLPESELYDLAQGYVEQCIQTYAFKKILSLNEKDRNKLNHRRPESLHELKTTIQNILVQKSKQNHIYSDMQFDPAYQINDPELIEAARLGKLALKDRKIMTLLWNKFKNQNKIATFLGVNRSSVNRRCKEFNLLS